jgi:hypothetical protein
MFNKTGTKASPDKVRALADRLNSILWDRYRAALEGGDGGNASENHRMRQVIDECLGLLADMESMMPEAVSTPILRSPAWDEALDQSPSKAAVGALNDALAGRHRRGGKAKPRQRWSLDELPPAPKPTGQSDKDKSNYMLAKLWVDYQKDNGLSLDAPPSRPPAKSKSKQTNKGNQADNAERNHRVAQIWADYQKDNG